MKLSEEDGRNLGFCVWAVSGAGSSLFVAALNSTAAQVFPSNLLSGGVK